MIKIGILKRKENNDDENILYMNAIKKYGGTPILIDKSNIEEINGCNGIIITGGYKKGILDDYLIEYALSNKLCLLGICQGMQSMAMYKSDYGLNLVNNHNKREGYIHDVFLTESKLSKIYNQRKIKVNSHHSECVVESKLFEIVGRSNDNIIEAIESNYHRFQIGVQWHPEKMLSYDLNSNKLMKKFIDSCK